MFFIGEQKGFWSEFHRQIVFKFWKERATGSRF